MKSTKQKVELTAREMALLLKYTCPLSEHAELLRASQPKDGWHIVHIDAYWVSHWIGDLVHAARTIRSQSLLEEIDGLCTALENVRVKLKFDRSDQTMVTGSQRLITEPMRQ